MDKYFLADAFGELWPKPERSYPYNMDTHPTVRCCKALSAYNRWRVVGIEEAKQKFLEGADWLVENQNPGTGAWEIPFDYKIPGYEARAPWASSIVQGMGLSVLARAVEDTRFGMEKRYTDALFNALNPFLRTTHNRGLAIFEDSGNWFEGMPSRKGYQILNEFMFALIGLAESTFKSNPRSRVFQMGMNTLKRHLPDFDLDLLFFKWSRYDNGLYFYAPPKYHWVQVQQLRWLAEKTGSAVCKEYAEKWDYWGTRYQDSTGKYLFIRFWPLYNKWLNWRYR